MWQTPVRTNDLLNALQYVLQPGNSRELAEAFPGLLLSQQTTADQSASNQPQHDTAVPSEQPTSATARADNNASRSRAGTAIPEMGLLAGDDYYRAKEQLITDEQILLRILCFQMNIEHPHKYLLNICRLLQCGQPVTQLALCLVRLSDGFLSLLFYLQLSNSYVS